MVYFHTEKSQLWYILVGLGIDFLYISWHLGTFASSCDNVRMSFWYILWSLY
jgi:hypothetical protein